MRALAIIAAKEVRDGLRNRWVVATTALLAVLSLSLVFLGSAPVGDVGVSKLAITTVSLSSLSIFLLPLIALLLAYDALVGEIEAGTMLLLLSYPVTRGQVLLGKFIGHATILLFATVVGYGCAGLAVSLGEPATAAENWRAFTSMILSSALLGAAFLALGYLISASVRQRAAAAGLAVAVWLVFVLLFDLALLGVLVADKGQSISASLLNELLLLNPADAYRLFNLAGVSQASALSGMTGAAAKAGLSRPALLAVMAAWVGVPLALAGLIFRRREL
jgi:Cu-processing system permease protein